LTNKKLPFLFYRYLYLHPEIFLINITSFVLLALFAICFFISVKKEARVEANAIFVVGSNVALVPPEAAKYAAIVIIFFFQKDL
jgi:hypothetical protein